MASKTGDKEIYCSFCGKPQDMVLRMIAGNSAYICDRCVMDIDDGEISESEIAGCIEDGVSPSGFYAD